ncbi:MAG: GntR family transcriptional regulator [Chitinivibrionales bacterium]|nr:GntR family transcriptional regulator [Chitinivibrionales bacterium]MBD3396629.1 GntR family transcriptional regulator [Chitinivibrionales bacterium]
MPLAERIAATIEETLRANPGLPVPSVREIVRESEVAKNTAVAALRILSSRGLVKLRNRRRPVRLDIPGESFSDHTSAGRFARNVRDKIDDGILRAGDTLPKQLHYILTDHVSGSTVSRAMSILSSEGLIHRQGKRWAVGPQPAAPAPGYKAREEKPVVLILVQGYDFWRDLFTMHSNLMISTFCTELKRFGHEYLVVQKEIAQAPTVVHADRRATSRDFFAAGRADILKTIQKLGDRYRGTFVVVHQKDLDDMRDWVSWLGQFDRPVVFLDIENRLPHLDRRTVGRRAFFRCYSEERALVRLAVSALADRGHRSAALIVPNRFAREDWLINRRELIADLCRQARLDLTVWEHNERLWLIGREPEYNLLYDYMGINPMFNHVDSIRESIRAAHPKATRARREKLLSQELARTVPSLTPLLKPNRATALIAANQWAAVNYLYWLKNVGIAVPKDLSLVAFDNYLYFSREPVTTVDQKLEDIAYKAAHIFVGDIPIRADRRGNIATVPELIDRGSIAGVARL